MMNSTNPTPNTTVHSFTYYKLVDLEGIGPDFSRKLADVGIHTTEDLISKASTPELRTHLASKTGIGDGLLMRWFQMADVMRLHGIGSQYGELLVSSGVSSLEKLRTYEPTALVEMLTKRNLEKKLVKSPPTIVEVQKWFEVLKDVPVVTPRS